MSRIVVFDLEADLELFQIAEWYERASPGLGSKVLAAVNALVARAADLPESFPIYRNGVREAYLRKYRYRIFFEAGTVHLRVRAVYHASRDERKLKSRF